MRYFTLTYYKQPNGQINEVAGTHEKLRTKDRVNCNVILDFKEENIIKCTVGGQGLSPDWLSVIEYFSKYYGDTFAKMIRQNNEE